MKGDGVHIQKQKVPKKLKTRTKNERKKKNTNGSHEIVFHLISFKSGLHVEVCVNKH